jgi:hypothetical protein
MCRRAEKLQATLKAVPVPVPPPRSCARCGSEELPRLRVCRGCDAVRYCGRECQRAHWLEHRACCSKLAAGAGAGAGAEVERGDDGALPPDQHPAGPGPGE